MEPTESGTESALLKRVDNGLEIAVRDAGLDWEDERNLVKREKFQYFAVRENSDELPVTYSWFRYGVSAIAPNIHENLPIGANDSHILEMDEEEIAEYYLERLDNMPLRDWWPSDVKVLEFLEQYYTIDCPPEIRELYLANVELRKILEQRILHRINHGGGSIPDQDYSDMKEVLLKIQTELASDSGEPVFEDELTLGDLYDDFLVYSDVLEDTILSATTKEDIPSAGPEYWAITKLKNTFDDTIWPYLTCIISARTGEGPNSGKVEGLASGKFDQVSSNIEQEIESADKQRREANLVAGFEDYHHSGEGVRNKVDELMNVLDGRSGRSG